MDQVQANLFDYVDKLSAGHKRLVEQPSIWVKEETGGGASRQRLLNLHEVRRLEILMCAVAANTSVWQLVDMYVSRGKLLAELPISAATDDDQVGGPVSNKELARRDCGTIVGLFLDPKLPLGHGPVAGVFFAAQFRRHFDMLSLARHSINQPHT